MTKGPLAATCLALSLGLADVTAFGQEQWGTLAEVEKNEVQFRQFQPPDRIMDAIGLKPGMVVGDVGAGAGRFAVPMARRVGATGRVYANDIDEAALSLIRERCQKYNIRNIETVKGTVEDTGLPKASLDLVIMVYTYHHLERPVALLRGLAPTLRPGGSVVIITGDPDKGVWTSLPRKHALARQFAEAGFDLVGSEDFLPRDYLLILKPRPGGARYQPTRGNPASAPVRSTISMSAPGKPIVGADVADSASTSFGGGSAACTGCSV